MIERHEIHLWRVSLTVPESTVRRLAVTLSDDELARASRFHFPEHRNAFVTARGILREILSRYVCCAPEELGFRYDTRGKPALAFPTKSLALRFNVAHATDVALYALANGRAVGVDIERIRPIPDAAAIVEQFFAPAETMAFRALPVEKRDAAFLTCWTRKEAYVKAVGGGLSMPLNTLDVGFTAGECPGLPASDEGPDGRRRWELRDLELGDGVIGALVVQRADTAYRLQAYDWCS